MTEVVEVLGWVLVLSGTVLSWIGLPGPFVFIAGLLVWLIGSSITWIGMTHALILIVLLLLAETAEQLGGFLGMSWTGIKRTGWIGAIVGAIAGVLLAGFLLNPLIVVLGLLAGAWVGEIVGGTPPLGALKVALGFGLGKFGGYVVKNTLVVSLLGYLVIVRGWKLIAG